MRKGYNFKALIARWDEVVMQLCEEVTPHDVLTVVRGYLLLVAKDYKRAKLKTTAINKACKLIEQACKQINPEPGDRHV